MDSYGLVQRTNSVTCISLLQLHLATWIHGRRSIYQATESRHYTGYHGCYLAQHSGSLTVKKSPDRDRDRPGTRSIGTDVGVFTSWAEKTETKEKT
jgi:hypothetical protein